MNKSQFALIEFIKRLVLLEEYFLIKFQKNQPPYYLIQSEQKSLKLNPSLI